jgi:hypothetical protein
MLQLQLAHAEAQRFALVQNVVDIQNWVVDLEIELEVWQAMAHQGKQPPDRSTGCTCFSRRATGSFGLE